MKYTKPPLSFEQQADLLLARGIVGDRGTIISRLKEVNYYRLSAYWHPFRQTDSDDIIPGTTFESVWRRYAFDRQLRLLVTHTDLQWREPVDVSRSQHRVFSIMTVLLYTLHIIAPQSRWQKRFEKVMADHPDIPLNLMGFPENWTDCPIWQTPAGTQPDGEAM